MIDLTGVDSADIFTVFLSSGGNICGLAYAPGFTTTSTPSIMEITYRIIPAGCPFILYFRTDLPSDYDTNPNFTPDWANPDGIGIA